METRARYVSPPYRSKREGIYRGIGLTHLSAAVLHVLGAREPLVLLHFQPESTTHRHRQREKASGVAGGVYSGPSALMQAWICEDVAPKIGAPTHQNMSGSTQNSVSTNFLKLLQRMGKLRISEKLTSTTGVAALPAEYCADVRLRSSFSRWYSPNSSCCLNSGHSCESDSRGGKGIQGAVCTSRFPIR